MITVRINEVLEEKKISNAQFAEMMGVARQNVKLLIETKNIYNIEKAAKVLGVPFAELITITEDGTPPSIPLNGFVEYKGIVNVIKSVEDLRRLLRLIDEDSKE